MGMHPIRAKRGGAALEPETILASHPTAARAVRIDGPAVWRLNVLWGNLEDVRFCASVLSHLMDMRSTGAVPADVEAALWSAVVVRYFRLFTRLRGSGALDRYSGGDRGKGSAFRRLQAARERIVKLDRTCPTRFATAVIEDEAGGFLGTVRLGTEQAPKQGDYLALARLIELAARNIWAYIDEARQELREGLAEEADRYSREPLWERPSERPAAPDAGAFRNPVTGGSAKTRRKPRSRRLVATRSETS